MFPFTDFTATLSGTLTGTANATAQPRARGSAATAAPRPAAWTVSCGGPRRSCVGSVVREEREARRTLRDVVSRDLLNLVSEDHGWVRPKVCDTTKFLVVSKEIDGEQLRTLLVVRLHESGCVEPHSSLLSIDREKEVFPSEEYSKVLHPLSVQRIWRSAASGARVNSQ